MISDVDLNCEINGNHHLGHIILNCLKRRCANNILQINAATDESETYGSVLDRVVRLARGLKNLGLKPGDVMTLGGVNHLDLRIPFYAGLMIGLPVVGVDPFFKYAEIKAFLELTQARVAFCDYNQENIYKKAAKEIGLDLIVFTFYEGDNSMEKLIASDEERIEDFQPSNFDTEKVFAFLISTSGTTGIPKLAAIKHENFTRAMINIVQFGVIGNLVKDGPQKVALILSPVQWLSAYVLAVCILFTDTVMLMTTKSSDVDHVVEIINKYKPTNTIGSPSIWYRMLENPNYDLTSFDTVAIGGAKVYKEMLTQLQKKMRPDGRLIEGYGQTENIAPVCISLPDTPFGSCGPVLPNIQAKLIDENGKEITEPNVPGELYSKGPMFSGYYNNEEETAKAITEDGWLKTGDQLYRDEKGNYYFIDRLKMLIKFRNIHIVPTELEEIIIQHPGVVEVCVTGIENKKDQEWPVACVVRHPDHKVTADEIKNIIAEQLSDSKHLRGGVIFFDELPKTSTGKVARMQVRRLAANMDRE